MLELLIGLVAIVGVAKVLGGSKRSAPVPPSQTAPSAAPSIPGHLIPTPAVPGDGLDGLYAYFASKGVTPPAALVANAWAADSQGIWRDGSGHGAPHQFTDCNDKPIGRAGYMPLRYKAWLDQNIGCDGQPISRPLVSGGPGDGAATAALQAGSQAALTAASAAVTAAGGGEAAAAGAAAAVGAAAAAI